MREETAHRPPAGVSASALLVVAIIALIPYLLLPPKPMIIDAGRAITHNEVVQKGTLGEIFTTDFWGVPAGAAYATNSYRPLVTLTYAAQARLFGNGPAPFRLVDMLLHAGAAVLCALLLAQLLRGSRWAVPLAALFAVHPVLSEAVACVVGRADLVASTAMLGALVLHGAAPRASGRFRPWHLEGAALALIGIALLSKEYSVAFPFVLSAFDLCRGLAGELSTDDRRRSKVVVGVAFGLLAGYLALRLALFGALGGVPMLGPGDHPLYDASMITRLSTASWLLVPSARLIAFPYGLNYFYGFGTLAIARTPFDPHALLGIALAAGCIVLALGELRRRRDPVPTIAAALFFLPLGPSLNTVSVAGVLFAERFLYLPTAGAILALGWALERFVADEKGRRIAFYAVVGVGLLFAALTFKRVEEWSSVESLARSSLRHYPDAPNVIFELGLALGNQGRHADAQKEFERSLALQDNRPQVWTAYALSLVAQSKDAQAVEAWRRALSLSPPDLGVLWRGLGDSALRAGEVEEAVRALTRAHELLPQDRDVPMLLANALVRLGQSKLAGGRPDEAVDLALRATRTAELPPDGLMLAGLLVHRAGEPDKARPLFRAAIAGDSGILGKRFRVAVDLDSKEKFAEAADVFREILVVRPDHVPTLFNLGRTLLRGGKPAEAAGYLEAGLELEADAGARALLAEARRQVRAGVNAATPTGAAVTGAENTP